jgi:S-layer protein
VQLLQTSSQNLTFKDGVAITAAANEGLGDGDNIVTSITLKGGNTLSSYTAAGAIDGTKLTSFDASAFNGTTSINVDSAVASAVTLKAGASTTDSLTYSAVNGLAAATTGKLVSTGFETVKLLTATAASTIDASGLAGATTIAVENDQNVTLSKLAAGTTIQLGATAFDESNATTTDDYTGTLTVSLADETGTADSIKFSVVNTDGNNNVSAILKTTAIETVEIAASTGVDTNDVQFDVSGVKAATLKLSGGATGELVDLTKGTTTLSSSTGTVDASSFTGSLTVSANANKATSLTTKTGAVTFVGSSAADTVTVGKAGAEITSDVGTSGLIDGGSGSDTLTAYVSTSASLRYVEAVETINLVAAATDADYTVTTFASSKGGNDASVVNVSGGQSGKVVTLGGDIDDHAVTIDASASAGSVAMTWAAGSKDAVSVSYALDTAENTGTFTMSGVETLNVASTFTTTQTAADVVDLTNVTGLTKVVLTTGATNPNSITVSKLTSATTVQLGLTPATGSEFQGVTAKLDLADATGTADSLNVSLFDTNAASSTATIQADGIETLSLTLADSTEDHKVALSNTNDNAATLNVTGVNTSADLTITSLADAYTTIAASGLKGKLTMADNSRTGTAAMTITSGTGADTLIQKNASDVIDAGTSGTGTDTLKVVANFVLGGIQVDLSSTTDQVTTFNSFANSAIQKGFENVDLSGITGTYGADVTARAAGSTIVGTGNIDNIIGGAGADTITMGKASTTLAYDAINAGAGSDTLVIVGSVTTSTTEAQNIIDLSSTTDQVSKVNNSNETTVQVGFENVNLSGLTVTSGGGFTITAKETGSSITGTSDTDVIIAGAGVDTITMGGAANTVVFGAGTSTSTAMDTIADLVVASVATTTLTLVDKGTEVGVTAGVLTATATDLSGAASLSAALNLLAAGNGGTNGIVKWGVYDGNTYIVEDMSVGATITTTDLVIKVTGTPDLLDSTKLIVTFA